MCRRYAEEELAHLGDATLGEWHEWSGAAYHLRRRLSAAEQEHVGPVVDVRGTDEARQRVAALPARLHAFIPPEVMHDEIGERP